MYIAVAGNIGSGKTTLTEMLAKHYGWTPRFESVTYNPYLEDYYGDIRRWAFNLEVYFLKERFKDMLEVERCPNTIIQDRSIYEGVHVFAANNYHQGNLSERDYQNYLDLFEQMTSMLKLPELMIYLRASVPHLVSNIQKRGRDYEQTIQLEYLTGLNNLYEEFITKHYPGRVLTIEVDGMDFLHDKADFASITNRIEPLIYGLFPLDANDNNQM